MNKVCKVCNTFKWHKSWKTSTCEECISAGVKYCPSCEQVYNLENFYSNKNGSISGLCKTCEKKRSKESKDTSGYYAKPEVRQRCSNASKIRKYDRYHTDEVYRSNVLLRASKRRDLYSDSTLTQEDWQHCLQVFDNTCAYCGSSKQLSMDHIVPISKEGPTCILNIVPACISCNTSKNNKDLTIWYPMQSFYTTERYNKIVAFMKGEVF